MVDALEITAADADADDELSVLASQLLTDEAPPLVEDEAAALMADEATAADTAPCAPAGKTNLTVAAVDPGAKSTVTAVAPGNQAIIAARNAAILPVTGGLTNVI